MACPSNNFASGQLCEFADGFCVPAGTRTVTLGTNTTAKEVSPVNFCGDNRFQNGDLDFDGISYRATSWPNGSPNVPQSFRFVGPFDGRVALRIRRSSSRPTRQARRSCAT